MQPMFPVKHCPFCDRERPLVCFPKLRKGHGPYCSWCCSKIKEGARRRTSVDIAKLSAAARKGWRSRKKMMAVSA